MIRFVDLRDAEIEGARFAFFDTVRDKFVEVCGTVAWYSTADFKDCVNTESRHSEVFELGGLPRFERLIPGWAREDGVRIPASIEEDPVVKIVVEDPVDSPKGMYWKARYENVRRDLNDRITVLENALEERTNQLNAALAKSEPRGLAIEKGSEVSKMKADFGVLAVCFDIDDNGGPYGFTVVPQICGAINLSWLERGDTLLVDGEQWSLLIKIGADKELVLKYCEGVKEDWRELRVREAGHE